MDSTDQISTKENEKSAYVLLSFKGFSTAGLSWFLRATLSSMDNYYLQHVSERELHAGEGDNKPCDWKLHKDRYIEKGDRP